MKRTKLLTALVLVSILVVSCASFKPTHKVKAEFDEIVATQLNTPKKVNKWLWYHFAYDHDKLRMAKSGFISIYSPWKTYREKSGVCFDSANFAGYCLSKVGYECELVFARAFPGRPGHVVCVFACKLPAQQIQEVLVTSTTENEGDAILDSIPFSFFLKNKN